MPHTKLPGLTTNINYHLMGHYLLSPLFHHCFLDPLGGKTAGPPGGGVWADTDGKAIKKTTTPNHTYLTFLYNSFIVSYFYSINSNDYYQNKVSKIKKHIHTFSQKTLCKDNIFLLFNKIIHKKTKAINRI